MTSSSSCGYCHGAFPVEQISPPERHNCHIPPDRRAEIRAEYRKAQEALARTIREQNAPIPCPVCKELVPRGTAHGCVAPPDPNLRQAEADALAAKLKAGGYEIVRTP